MSFSKLMNLCTGDPPRENPRWGDYGCLTFKANWFPADWSDVCDAYIQVREKADGWEKEATPYMKIPELMALCCHGSLAATMEEIVGEPVGVHLNLCGWTTTGRDWHADGYLSGPFVKDYYVAAWVALGEITYDAGPFEYVPGTHRWPGLDQAKVQAELLRQGLTTPARIADGSWPWDSEKLLTPLFEAACHEKGLRPRQFLASKGDVLLWHPGLWHRGSPAATPGKERRSLIFHASGIRHRPDFPVAVQSEYGGFYFPIGGTIQHPTK